MYKSFEAENFIHYFMRKKKKGEVSSLFLFPSNSKNNEV